MMTIQAAKFTPEVLLSAPRRSAGVPNSTGELILYTVSSYSFKSHAKTSQIRVLSVSDDVSLLISEDGSASEPVWIAEHEIAYIKSLEHGGSALVAQHVLDKDKHNTIHHFGASISNPKTKRLSPHKVAFCCVALTGADGEMHNPATQPKSHSTAKTYTSLFARHWDSWLTESQNSLWYGQLEKLGNGRWTLGNGRLANLLAGTRLSSPVPPFGGTGDYDICATGIVFVAKDPDLNPARFTKSDLYYVPIASYLERAPRPPVMVRTGKLQGYSIAPVFSGDGKKVAFARMRSNQYEADKTRLLLIPDVADLSNVQEFFETGDGKGAWPYRPDWILWSHDDRELYVGAEKHARTVLWKLPASPSEVRTLPTPISIEGNVVDAKLLGQERSLLVTTRSRVESSVYSIVDIADASADADADASVRVVSSTSKQGKSFGLTSSQCSEFWYPGAKGYDIHALVTAPSDFDPRKKYPLAFLIHGGPQSAWMDDWSTRWNPAIFAEQGYFVVCPNPTGSTGYGQEHIDAIQKNWGGTPYEDLVRCFEYIERNLDYVDTTRAVALGASYGGYMINWIQGHDLGRKFKALVCHDGVFSTSNMWSTEELFFPEHDFGGTLWEQREHYERWDPAKHTANWSTPQLVIHNELDYRLPVSEGVAMFNVLQARGVPSKLVVFPDENHWVLKPENSRVWHQEVLDWINKYSGVSAV